MKDMEPIEVEKAKAHISVEIIEYIASAKVE